LRDRVDVVSEDKVGFSKKQKHSELCCVFWRRSTVAAGDR